MIQRLKELFLNQPMYPLKYRVILMAILVAVLLPLFYCLFMGFSLIKSEPSYLVVVAPYFFTISIVTILLLPVIVGGYAHWFVAIIFSILTLFIALSTNIHIYNIQIFILLAMAVICHIFFKYKFKVFEQKIASIEKVKEATNLLKSDLAKTDQLNRSLANRLERYRRLRQIGESFSAKLSVDEIANLTVRTAYEMIPDTDSALLFMADETTQKLILNASVKSSELPKIKSKNGDIFDKWVFKERQPLNIHDIDEDYRFDYTPLKSERPFKSLISVPLISQSRLRGILRLNSKNESAYTFDDLRLLDFISDLASSSIGNARLYKTTEELSTKDSLTGLYIHRYIKKKLAYEFDKARLNSSALSVIMVDIDHFKDYNDKYGHSAGDKVLMGISNIIRKNTIGSSYILARYGGEEFVVVMPNVVKNDAVEFAQKLRKDIESHKFVLRRIATNVTISAGVASYVNDVKDSDELLKKTDYFLYKAKKEGRNKVCVA